MCSQPVFGHALSPDGFRIAESPGRQDRPDWANPRGRRFRITDVMTVSSWQEARRAVPRIPGGAFCSLLADAVAPGAAQLTARDHRAAGQYGGRSRRHRDQPDPVSVKELAIAYFGSHG